MELMYKIMQILSPVSSTTITLYLNSAINKRRSRNGSDSFRGSTRPVGARVVKRGWVGLYGRPPSSHDIDQTQLVIHKSNTCQTLVQGLSTTHPVR